MVRGVVVPRVSGHLSEQLRAIADDPGTFTLAFVRELLVDAAERIDEQEAEILDLRDMLDD